MQRSKQMVRVNDSEWSPLHQLISSLCADIQIEIYGVVFLAQDLQLSKYFSPPRSINLFQPQIKGN